TPSATEDTTRSRSRGSSDDAGSREHLSAPDQRSRLAAQGASRRRFQLGLVDHPADGDRADRDPAADDPPDQVDERSARLAAAAQGDPGEVQGRSPGDAAGDDAL